jgi:hypothetical protein
MWYQWVAGAVTAAGLMGCLAFVATYHISSRGAWRETSEGRYLMATKTILASLFLLVLSTQLFGDWPGRQVVAVVLYATYAVFPWWLYVLLLRAIRRKQGG